jgi:hypothetical protein
LLHPPPDPGGGRGAIVAGERERGTVVTGERERGAAITGRGREAPRERCRERHWGLSGRESGGGRGDLCRSAGGERVRERRREETVTPLVLWRLKSCHVIILHCKASMIKSTMMCIN